MEKPTHLPYAAAIDPLALLFPDYVYVKIVEGLHPNEPPTAAVEGAIADMSVEDKKAVVSRARRMVEYGQAVQKAVAKTM
jgi:hypothetical protein